MDNIEGGAGCGHGHLGKALAEITGIPHIHSISQYFPTRRNMKTKVFYMAVYLLPASRINDQIKPCWGMGRYAPKEYLCAGKKSVHVGTSS